MESAAVIVIAVALLLFFRWLQREPKPLKTIDLNYLIPGDDDEPLMPREVFVSGINKVGLCGLHRQKVIKALKKGEEIILIRDPHNTRDPNAVILYRKNGCDIGYLPEFNAAYVAPRLDNGSPVTARYKHFDWLKTEKGETIRAPRLELVPHRLRKGMSEPEGMRHMPEV